MQNLLSNSAVKAVVSGYASTSNFEINNFARANMIYMIGANAAQTAGIIKPDPSRFQTVWSVVPSYAAYGTGPVDLLNKWVADGSFRPAHKTAYIITSNNPYSEGISQGLQTHLKQSGWQVVGNQTVPFGPIEDWGTVLAQIRSANPGFIVDTDYQISNEITFLRQFLSNPTKSLMFIQYGPSEPAFIKDAGAAGNGVLYNELAGEIGSPRYQPAVAFNKLYTAAYHTSLVNPEAVITYSEVMIYANALRKVGNPNDFTQIGKAIGSSVTVTPGGTVRFDPTDHLAVEGPKDVPLQSSEIEDQRSVLIDPAQYATGKFTLPPWFSK